MHTKSETDLRKLASQCLHKHGVDAWTIYRDEARARYSAEDDGPLDSYSRDATAIFLKVAGNTKGALRRFIRSGRIPMPTLPVAA